MAAGDTATARDATLFLFNRQQLADGSMPRNSLVNGKTAPDSFGTQLDETAYPILMADELGLSNASLYTRPHQAGRELPRRARPLVRLRAVGGAVAASRRRPSPPRSPAWSPPPHLADVNQRRRLGRVWRGVADDLQRSIKGWTVTTNGPAAEPSVLHPAVQDRRPERCDHLQRRQRRTHARPARGHRRRVPRADPPRRAAGERPRRRSSRCRSSTRRSRPTHRAGPAGTATTATATATGRSTGTRGRPAARAPATCGPCCRPSVASSRIQTGDSADRDRAARRHGAASPRASGIIPEQDWELPDLAASPFGTDPTPRRSAS